jgi:2-keto-3-deoxy-L-rhamnonate aldolase RhmA
MLNNHKTNIGSWITLSHPSIAEIMADSGFDWLCIDLEHSVIDYNQAQYLIAAIQSKKKLAYVRVGENNSRIIKRVLDAGADGIIVPMVKTKKDAEKAVDSVKYPPMGKRGVGLARAQGYGSKFEQYLEKQKTLDIIVQIEHLEAINNLESILTVNGITGSIIGPYDLSASIGKPGDFNSEELKSAVNIYEKVSLKLNMPMGYHIVEPDAEKFLDMKKKGYQILALSFDALFLSSIILENLAFIRKSS